MTLLKTISVKLPAEDVRRIPSSNRSAFIRDAVREKLARQEKIWKPKTKFGRELAALQKGYKGKLLTREEIAAEIRENRGAMA
jgi:Arc/MetJ-type ribon-helix-helix transcriptional regulator